MSFAPPPEFFFDRSLGKETARRLRETGWRIHLLADLYADDAQAVADEDWIAEGTRRGWALLSKDQRIRYRGSELAALHGGQLFCLANGNLGVEEMVTRFTTARGRIEGAASARSAGFWKLYDGGRIVRTWP